LFARRIYAFRMIPTINSDSISRHSSSIDFSKWTALLYIRGKNYVSKHKVD